MKLHFSTCWKLPSDVYQVNSVQLIGEYVFEDPAHSFGQSVYLQFAFARKIGIRFSSFRRRHVLFETCLSVRTYTYVLETGMIVVCCVLLNHFATINR